MTKIPDAVLYRTLTLDRAAMDEEARTVPASLSSEIEIPRWFGKEVLTHTKEAVNLERASDGLPMLFGHDQDQPIGLVDDVRVDGGKLRGMLRFSKNTRAEEIWSDVRDGFLKNISIGYRIDKWEEESDTDLVRATRWTPFEASVVSVPADHTVGVNRAEKGTAMPKDDTTKGTEPGVGVREHEAPKAPPADDNINVVAFREAKEKGYNEGIEAARDLRRKTNRAIDDLFKPFIGDPRYRDVRDLCVREEYTLEKSQRALYNLWADQAPEPVAADIRQVEGSANSEDEQLRSFGGPKGNGEQRATVKKDAIENLREAAVNVLLIRTGVETDKDIIAAARKSEYLSMGPVELAREYLRLINVPTNGMTRDAIIGRALTTRGLISHSTSDFANILEDASNKSLQMGYEETPETWRMWCSVGSIPDFRPANRPNMSAFGDLDIIYEGGEYKYGTFSDLKEVLTLATYGKLFSITRQALVNDDLGALSRIPRSMGRAAARVVGDQVYNILINNPTLNQDATALFHANHGNFVAGGSGAAPSVATVEAARTAMATQTDPSGSAILNIRPAHLIVPYALEGTSRALAAAEYDPAGTAGTLTPNTVRGTFDVIAEGRLDADDAAKWYMAASTMMVETIEVAFLDGIETPYMEQQEAWSTDGVSYKVRLDAVAAPLDFRGLYHNDGN